MGRRTAVMAAGAALAAAAALAGWVAHDGGGPLAPARAQSVSLLEEAEVALEDIGRLAGTSVVYVEFADGARCVVADNGAGDVDCDWTPGGR